MDLNINNIIELFSIFSTIFLGFFILMASVINQDIKGVIYIAFICILFVLIEMIVRPVLGIRVLDNRSHTICDIFNINFPSYPHIEPSLVSAFMGFTMTYLLAPSLLSGHVNYFLGGLLISLTFLTSTHRVLYACNRWWTEILGVSIGVGFASLVMLFMNKNNYSHLLYYDELISNKQSCGVPKKQNYRCEIKMVDTTNMDTVEDIVKNDKLDARLAYQRGLLIMMELLLVMVLVTYNNFDLNGGIDARLETRGLIDNIGDVITPSHDHTGVHSASGHGHSQSEITN